MRSRSPGRWALLCLIALGLLGSGLWSALSGLSFLTTRGTSMQPSFYAGDLAITAEVDSYRVGDIVAYRPTPDAVVLHRIRSITGDRFVFKGDNNDWLDPVQPRKGDLVGRLVLRVPGAGFIAEHLADPSTPILLFGAALMLMATGGAERDRRQRRQGNSNAPARPATGGAGRNKPMRSYPLAAPLAALVGSCLLGALVFDRPTITTSTTEREYKQTVSYEYQAEVEPGVTYPDGAIQTGAPVFLRLADALGLSMRYRMDASELGTLRGTYRVDAELSDPSSGTWRRTVPLIAETPFMGTGFRAAVVLDLEAINAEVAAMRAETGVAGNTVAIAVVPTVELTGRLSGQALKAKYNEPLELTLTPLQLSLTTPPKTRDAPLEVTKTASLDVETTKPAAMTFVGRSMSVDSARLLLTFLALSASAWLAWAVAAERRRREASEVERIGQDYRDAVIDVDALPELESVVDVAEIAVLHRVAEHGGHLILHVASAMDHEYVVIDGETAYRYRTRVVATADGAVDDPGSPPVVVESSELSVPEPLDEPAAVAIEPDLFEAEMLEPEMLGPDLLELEPEVVEPEFAAVEPEPEPEPDQDLVESEPEPPLVPDDLAFDAQGFERLLAQTGLLEAATDSIDHSEAPATLDEATRLREMTPEELAIFGFLELGEAGAAVNPDQPSARNP